MTGTRTKVTEEQAVDMVRLYQAGHSIAGVSRQMNLPASTVASNLGKRIKLRAPGRIHNYTHDDHGNLKTGKGRAKGRAAIADVSTLPCPAGGLHVLENDTRARTSCTGCGATWADLDATIREGS